MLFISLSLSLSLSLVNTCMCKGQEQQKKKPQLKQTNHYKFAYLWASLVLPQHKYSKSDFFFSFSFEQNVINVNLMFLGHCGRLRLHHFILERVFSKSKSLFLNLKQDLSFYYYYYYFRVKKHSSWSIYEEMLKPVWLYWFLIMLVESVVCTICSIFLSFLVLTNNQTRLRFGSWLNWPVQFGF